MTEPESTADAARTERLRRLTGALELPMGLLSLVFLALVIAEVTTPNDAPYAVWIDRGTLLIWAIFLVEFLLKLAIAPSRFLFLKQSWFDLLSLALPMVRVFRAFRLFKTFRALRAIRFVAIARLGTAARRSTVALRRFLRESRFGYVSAVTGVVVLVGAAGMLFLEQDAPDSRIRSFEDALWWSAALITTVGSDLQPVTGPGRLLAVAMMLYSVIVFGYLVSRAVVFIQGAPQDAEDGARSSTSR